MKKARMLLIFLLKISLAEIYIKKESEIGAPKPPRRLNEAQMNRRIREKIQRGHFTEETYKQCIADELLKSGTS